MVEVRTPAPGTEEADVVGRLRAAWGDTVARRGELVDPTAGPLLAAYDDGRLVGVAAYALRTDGCEVVAIDAFPPGRGTGRALMDAIERAAREAGCRRLWLVTTNDNTDALAFYQLLGYDLVAVRLGAVDAARRDLKPHIPVTSARGVPIRHELELERPVSSDQDRSVEGQSVQGQSHQEGDAP